MRRPAEHRRACPEFVASPTRSSAIPVLRRFFGPVFTRSVFTKNPRKPQIFFSSANESRPDSAFAYDFFRFVS
jgi:hypothetical protein